MSLKLIYLDQCVASDLALGNPPWDRLRTLVESKVAEGKILCPLSFETILESTLCDEATRIALANFFDKVSGGWRIKCFDELVGEETIHLVRKQPFCLLDRYVNLIPVEPGHANFMRRAFQDGRAKLTARAEAVQYQPEQLGLTVKEVRKSGSRERAGQLWRDIQRLLAGQTTEMEAGDFYLDLIRAKFTEEELIELCEHILHHRWEAIPVNYVEMLIAGQWEFEMTRQNQNPRKYKFNDEIDRWRAAVALAYCDALITDGGAAELARVAVRGLDAAFPCQIFSTRDISEIEGAIKLM